MDIEITSNFYYLLFQTGVAAIILLVCLFISALKHRKESLPNCEWSKSERRKKWLLCLIPLVLMGLIVYLVPKLKPYDLDRCKREDDSLVLYAKTTTLFCNCEHFDARSHMPGTQSFVHLEAYPYVFDYQNGESTYCFRWDWGCADPRHWENGKTQFDDSAKLHVAEDSPFCLLLQDGRKIEAEVFSSEYKGALQQPGRSPKLKQDIATYISLDSSQVAILQQVGIDSVWMDTEEGRLGVRLDPDGRDILRRRLNVLCAEVDAIHRMGWKKYNPNHVDRTDDLHGYLSFVTFLAVLGLLYWLYQLLDSAIKYSIYFRRFLTEPQWMRELEGQTPQPAPEQITPSPGRLKFLLGLAIFCIIMEVAGICYIDATSWLLWAILGPMLLLLAVKAYQIYKLITNR